MCDKVDNCARRAYVFTLNNYTEDDVANLKLVGSAPIRYICFGCEVAPSTGTPHLQGYMELSKPMRATAVRKLIKCASIWLQGRFGSREEAREYTRKEGVENWFETGDWESGGQGTRNDLRSVMKMVKEGKTRMEISETEPEIASKCSRFLQEYREDCEKEATKEFRQVETIVLVGAAGCGKTRSVFEEDPDVFSVNCEDSFPFNGYNGEKSILFDDFYGGIKYSQLLRILDGYQQRVNVKNGCRYAQWTKVYITSNEKPDQWYLKGLTPALKRRLTSVTEFPDTM